MGNSLSQSGDEHPDYNFHMPKPITYPVPVAIVSVLIAVLMYFLIKEKQPMIACFSSGIIIVSGLVYLGIFAMLKRITNLELRLEDRDKLLDEIPWTGDEVVLDVGCGNGILLLSAVKRLTTGKGIGVDIWTENSGDNRPEIFTTNAMIEGVADRVTLQNEDARHLPYEDETFDVILSGLTMHHMKAETKKAIREMARVLKPWGWMAIYDEPSTVFYCSKLMRQNGLRLGKKYVNMIFGTKA